ncbi:hypothetical protein COO60DRAFT_638565 [Scenedesmus sp. NREL 46B-D3]|nr:hypothetical protein COO60DRAFT_638565 [Scenedesmus sp. NREL 46B-D3]
MSHSLPRRHAAACYGKPVGDIRSPPSPILRSRTWIWQQRTSSVHGADLASSAVDATSASLVDRASARNWMDPLEGSEHPDPSCRPIVCLGKFDALHKGHQSLAAAALALGGSPVLLSFSGMGAVLGWQPRKPLVAPCDRPRVLDLWAQQLSQQQQQQQQQQQYGVLLSSSSSSSTSYAAADASQQQQQQQQFVPIRQHYIPFAAIRAMSPEAFVQLLQRELGAAGVVAGANYRFGYRAVGDSAVLQQLCAAAGLPSRLVELVGAAEPGAVGVVSSSKIREMLATCRIEAARKSLGRLYRLVAAIQLPLLQQQRQQQRQQHMWPRTAAPTSSSGQQHSAQHRADSSGSSSSRMQNPQDDALYVPLEQLLNQHPGPGVYQCTVQLYLGATAHDDLLHLQRAAAAAAAVAGGHQVQSQAADASSWSSGSAVQLLQGLHVAGSSCCAAVTVSSQQVVVSDSGVTLPADMLQLAAAALGSCTQVTSSSSSSGSSSSSSSSSGGSRNNNGIADVGSVSNSRSSSNSTHSLGSPSITSSSSTHSRRCDASQGLADPCCWDTDDNDDSSDDDADDESAAVQALLVLDVERCLQQTCIIPDIHVNAV